MAKITPEMVLVGKMYVALTKEHWEKGTTVSEAVDAAQDWYWNNFGESEISASEGMRRLSISFPSRKRTKRGGGR